MQLWILLFTAFLMVSGLNRLDAQGMQLSPAMKREFPEQGYLYISDSSGSLHLEQIRSGNNDWLDVKERVFSPGYSRSVHWLKLGVNNSTPEEIEYYLVQMFTGVSHFSVYAAQGQGRYKVQRSGEIRNQNERKVPHTVYAIPLTAPAGSESTLYLRYHSHASLNIAPAFYTPEEFYSYNNGTFYGEPLVWVYYGFLLIMAIYNCIVFLLIRDRSHFYYTLYLLLLALTMFSVFGQSYLYLWPESVHWNMLSYHFFPNLVMFSLLQFARHFTKMRDFTRSGDNLLLILGYVNLFVSCLMLVSPDIYISGPIGAIILIISIVPLKILVLYITIVKKSRQGAYFTGALSVFLGSLMILVAQSLFEFSLSTSMIYFFLLGSSLEVIILSLGLADQLRKTREKVLQAERRYSHLVENSSDLIFTMDRDLRIKSFNEAMEVRLGYPGEELYEKRLSDLFFDEMISGLAPNRFFSGELMESFLQNRRPLVFTRGLNPRYGLEPLNYLIKLEYVWFNSEEVILGHAIEHIGDSLASLPYRENISYITGSSSYSKLDYISERFTENLTRFFNTSDILRIRNALREALLNAMEHGNPSISMEEKDTRLIEGNYKELAHARRKYPEKSSRRIKVQCSLQAERVVYQISDEGMGFEYQDKSKTYENNTSYEGKSRGLNFISMVFDTVEFSGVGNQLKLSKYFPGSNDNENGTKRRS